MSLRDVVPLQKFTELFDGWHAAIYVSDFSGAFRAMEAANLIYTEHGFFDANISGLRDAQKFHQFRFQASLCSIPVLLAHLESCWFSWLPDETLPAL